MGICVAMVALLALRAVDARIENLHVEGDMRTMIAVDTFGFDKGGIIDLTVKNLKVCSWQLPAPSPSAPLRPSHAQAL